MGMRQFRYARACWLGGITLALLLTGCTSPERQQYVTLHSMSVAPGEPGNDEVSVAFGLDSSIDSAHTIATAQEQD